MKTPYELAVFMYKHLRNMRKPEIMELVCWRIQTARPDIFEHLCNIVTCMPDYRKVAKKILALGNQPLIVEDYE